MSFTDQIVVVTGGSRGIGREIALRFASEGARVVIVFRTNRDQAEDTINAMNGAGHLSVQSDISDPQQVADLFQQVISELGKIDVVVNNAGIGFHHPVDTTSYDDWRSAWEQILATNLIGPSNVCHQVAHIMIAQGYGKIINVSSRGAFRGEPDQPAYGASKAGLNSMTQSLASKLSTYGIFVGAVAPGFVETDMAFERLQGASGKRI